MNSPDYKLVVIAGGNDSGKTLSTKLLSEKIKNVITLTATFREGLTVYQNFSLLIHGKLEYDFIDALKKISQDVLLEKTRVFHSEHVSFGFYLKAIVSQIYSLNFRTLLAETEEDKKIRNELDLRKYLFNFGEAVKKIDSQIWAKALFSLIESKAKKKNIPPLVIINDLRFAAELKELINLGKSFKMINITRENVQNIDYEIINQAESSPNIAFYRLENNGSTEDLLNSLLKILDFSV